jgi:glycosyltransferase involved in cell wall biosynthesis
MMNESHAGTAQARGVFAWLKQKIVCTFDVGLVGGAPQRRYFHSLGLPEERLFKGYDAVDNLYFAQNAAVARSDAPALRLAYGLPPRYFLNIGRMEEKKNLECLVEAFAWALQRASANTEPPRLVFVGSGPEESGLREQCAALGLSFADGRTIDRLRPAMAPLGVQVMFYGFRQIEELPVFYGLAEAFVLPSIEEEWGLVVNEAMACGCAVLVSSNAGCCEDLVENEVNGWSFDPGRAEDLGARLLALAEDPQLARRMGEAGAARIKSWGCENFAENALKAAQAALSR